MLLAKRSAKDVHTFRIIAYATGMRIDPAGEFLMFDPANRSDIDAHRTSCMTQEALSRERRLMSDYDQRNDNDQNQKNASDPVRQEAIHDKRAKIIKKATRLFIKKGYAQTTMRDISKATGINLGNLYIYILYLLINFF